MKVVAAPGVVDDAAEDAVDDATDLPPSTPDFSVANLDDISAGNDSL